MYLGSGRDTMELEGTVVVALVQDVLYPLLKIKKFFPIFKGAYVS